MKFRSVHSGRRSVALGLLLLAAMAGCTEQEKAKNWGGTMTKRLGKGQKLVMVTWKAEDLWILTRPMRSGEVAETYEFQEESSYGLMQGKVIIQEEVAWAITGK
jgi:hypothetical protein